MKRRDDVLALYRLMCRIRAFEERVSALSRAGSVPGHVHLALGQEAVAAGVSVLLDDGDVVTASHRGHGAALGRGVPPLSLFAEIMGRADGLCGGKGGSMHLSDPERGLLATNGIVGAQVPLALGAALALRQGGGTRVCVTFLGDGAINQGAVLESFNLAAVLRLPVLFVVEANGFGEYTETGAVTAGKSIAHRIRSFGFPALEADGSDVFAVRRTALSLLGKLRKAQGPAAVIADVPRFSGHHDGDAQPYREASALASMRAMRDPIARAARLIAANWRMSAQEMEAIGKDAEAEMARAAQDAAALPPAPASSARTGAVA